MAPLTTPERVIKGSPPSFAQPVRLVYEPALGQGNARNAGWRAAQC